MSKLTKKIMMTIAAGAVMCGVLAMPKVVKAADITPATGVHDIQEGDALLLDGVTTLEEKIYDPNGKYWGYGTIDGAVDKYFVSNSNYSSFGNITHAEYSFVEGVLTTSVVVDAYVPESSGSCGSCDSTPTKSAEQQQAEAAKAAATAAYVAQVTQNLIANPVVAAQIKADTSTPAATVATYAAVMNYIVAQQQAVVAQLQAAIAQQQQAAIAQQQAAIQNSIQSSLVLQQNEYNKILQHLNALF